MQKLVLCVPFFTNWILVVVVGECDNVLDLVHPKTRLLFYCNKLKSICIYDYMRPCLVPLAKFELAKIVLATLERLVGLNYFSFF